MITVIGIRFRSAGKIYYFDPEDVTYEQGQHAIVETARGVEYGQVVIPNREIKTEEVIQPLKKVIRLATAEDDEKYTNNKTKEKDAFSICKEKIIKHGLDMKLIDVEYTFDNNKVLFYFTSYERVDFRELVKELAAIFKTRIELRQIGVRDETKMCGGMGICGRSLCCNTFLGDFQPVSIKMAKEQSLSLNPIKISGICGRLMCCLKYEQDCYVEIRDRLPEVGDIVITPEGKGEVISINLLREQIKVIIRKKEKDKEEKQILVFPNADIKIVTKKKKCCEGHNDDDYSGFDFSALE